MKRLKDIPPMFREALCIFSAFRKLGFAPEEIFLAKGLDMSKVPSLLMGIRIDDRDFFVSIAPCSLSDDEVASIWRRAIEIYKNTSQKEAQKLWETSKIKKESIEFVTAILRKGFTIPLANTTLN